MATCSGLPDSLPSQAFLNASGVVVTNRPWRRTGIPSEAQRLNDGSRMAQESSYLLPVRESDSIFDAACFFTRFAIAIK